MKIEDKTAVAVIADISNATVEEPFVRQVQRAIANDASLSVTITAKPLLNRLHTENSEAELREQLNSNTNVVVAMIGIPSSSHYERDIHQLLTAWSGSKKPVLLIASCDTQNTQKAVDNWQGWELLAKQLHQPIETLKKTVIVNDEYLVAQGGEKALAEITKCLKVAESLKPMLTPPQPLTPSIHVQLPEIEGMTILPAHLI